MTLEQSHGHRLRRLFRHDRYPKALRFDDVAALQHQWMGPNCRRGMDDLDERTDSQG